MPVTPPAGERELRLDDLVAVVLAGPPTGRARCRRGPGRGRTGCGRTRRRRRTAARRRPGRWPARWRPTAGPRTARRTAASCRGPSGRSSRRATRPTPAARGRGASGRAGGSDLARGRVRIFPEVASVEWLNTTCTIYRGEALPSPPFCNQFTGYSLMEDLALSL